MVKESEIRKVVVYGNYFQEFYNTQNPKTKAKIDWLLYLLKTVQFLPNKYFKHLTGSDGLYEIRIKVGSDIFRIFCFFDEGQLIVLANGFQKKTQKTPKSEIERALKIKKEYENDKNA